VLREEPLVAIIEVGERVSEVLILARGVPMFARSLSVGLERFPEGADALLRELRQTLLVWQSTGEPAVERAFICGGGAEIPGIETFLGERLQLQIHPLPALELESVPVDQIVELPRYAKAIAIALGLKSSSKSFNLRQGELSYQRGFGFLKQKVPLLAGLGVALLASFLFWAWAEGRALAHQNETLQAAVEELAQQTFGEEVEDVARINELLDVGGKEEKDPQPEVDAFDLALLLAAHIPKTMEHDVDELDLQRGHVKLTGVVNSTEDAQKIAEGLKKERCLKDVTISKITQQVKSSRQKYAMEFDLRCQDIKKKGAAEGEEN
jgi:general secretion pathway protein L